MPMLISHTSPPPTNDLRHKAKIVAIVLMGCAAFGVVLWVSLSDRWKEKTMQSYETQDTQSQDTGDVLSDTERQKAELDLIAEAISQRSGTQENAKSVEQQKAELDALAAEAEKDAADGGGKISAEEQKAQLDALAGKK